MELAYEVAKVLSIAAFLLYGLSRLRRFTGLLGVAGALVHAARLDG